MAEPLRSHAPRIGLCIYIKEPVLAQPRTTRQPTSQAPWMVMHIDDEPSAGRGVEASQTERGGDAKRGRAQATCKVVGLGRGGAENGHQAPHGQTPPCASGHATPHFLCGTSRPPTWGLRAICGSWPRNNLRPALLCPPPPAPERALRPPAQAHPCSSRAANL